MRSRARASRPIAHVAAILAVSSTASFTQPLHAGPPAITMVPGSVKIRVTSSSLVDTIDALSRAGGFKVSYDGARPSAVLFNADIDTPSLSEALFRLLDGQNLNYAMIFDKSGRNVTSLMILGSAPKSGTAPSTPGGGSRPSAFAPPRAPKNDLPPVDDDLSEAVEVPVPATPAPTPTPAPAPTPIVTFPGPFAPRSPFGNPPPPRPVPTPSA